MSNVRILLADDHAIVRNGIRKVIEEIPGLEVAAEVGNGPDIFNALASYPVDCLVMDVTMPEFDPIKDIRRIKTLYPDIKILVVSAYDDDFYVQGLFGAGVHGYHLKDQPLNDLKLALERVLEGERWISGSLISKLFAPSQAAPALPTLTNRQRTLLHYLKQGLDNQSIAQESGLSVKTVENHLTRLYRQLDVQSRLEAVNYIIRHPQILGMPGQDASQGALKSSPAYSKNLTVLVVDDNSRYRKQLQRMVGKLQPAATVYEAEDILDAVHLAKLIDIHLALIDVILGEEDGISCARRIKAVRPQTRIILISAYPDREFHRQGLQSGAVAFLDKKDLDLPALRQVLEDVIV